jgi:hypothetical protein
MDWYCWYKNTLQFGDDFDKSNIDLKKGYTSLRVKQSKPRGNFKSY